VSKVTEIIALIFDFDDTLVPDSTTKLLAKHAIDTDKFWKVQARSLIERGYDQAPAYLKLMLDNVGEGKPLGKLSNRALMEFGATLDSDFHPGLPQFFDDVKSSVEEHENIEVEFYIISGGLQAVVEGSGIVQKYFTGVYGCQLDENENGQISYIKRCVTFTEKTRYLFEINKGISSKDSQVRPNLVNKFIPESDRRVPFSHMIYVGDGLTDMPCFALVKKNKGKTFGVFDPSSESKAKLALEEFMEPNRVTGMYRPDYRREADLGIFLRTAVGSLCFEIESERRGIRRE
jgi:phosphoglycolate phosphatase-like HAD superfamily hydrolase